MASANAKPQTSWLDNIQPAYIDGVINFLNEDGDLKEGIYTDIENEVYHKLEAYSSSLIKVISKDTPAHAYRQFFSDIERKRSIAQTRTFDTGTLGHELILEPDGFLQRYFRLPLAVDCENALITGQQLSQKCKSLNLVVSGTKAQMTKRLLKADPSIEIFDNIIEKLVIKEAGFLAYEQACSDVKNKKATSLIKALHLPHILKLCKKKPVDGLVWNDAMRILETFSKHARAPRFINNGYAELTVIARCPNTGLLLKCRFDYINKLAIASDVKTTRSACPSKFANQSKDLAYDIQASFYKYVANLANIPVTLFAFISIEYIEADICEIFEISKKRQTFANDTMKNALDVLAECIESDLWYGYTKFDEIIVIDF